MKRTHGESNKSKEWNAWGDMIQRCTNPNNKRFYSHGARGISVCNRWLKFENFLIDMGRAPAKEYSLDRIDNDGNYQKDNCRWATRIEQANNRRSNIRVEFQGRTQTLKQWCDELKLPYLAVKARLEHGHTVDSAFKHVYPGKRIDSIIVEFNGQIKSLTEWSRELGISYTTLKHRFKRGLEPEQILS